MSTSSQNLKYIFSIVLKGLQNPGKIFSRDEFNHDNPFIIDQNLQGRRKKIKNIRHFLDYFRHCLH